MTSLTVRVPDEIATDLAKEAERRKVSVDVVASERLATAWLSRRKPKSSPGPRRSDNPEEIIGAFNHVPGFIEMVADIIDQRANRYRAKD
jgi:hypothetical protein